MRELAKSRLYLHRPCSMMVTLFEITGNVDLDHFKVALASAMNRHEQLKSKITIKGDGEAFYEPIPRANVKLKVETYEPAEDDDVESLMDIAFEWAEEAVTFSLNLSEGELMRHILLSDGVKAVWGIASHYLAGDAPSIQYLARDVFALLDDSSLKLAPPEWRAPENEEVLNVDALAWPAKFKVKRMNKIWQREGKSFTWPDLERMQKNFHEAYPLYILHESLEAEFTDALRQLAHDHKLRFSMLFAAAYLKATADKEAVSLLLSTRPEGYEGVGTYQGGISIDVSKMREHDLLEIAKMLSDKTDEAIQKPEQVHHSAIVLLGMDENLIDSAYYFAYDGYKAKSAEMMAQLYGLTRVGSGTQINNMTVIPAEEEYAFGRITQVYVIPPLAPNFSRSISLSTVSGRLGIVVNFYLDEAYENFLLKKVISMLREAAGLPEAEAAEDTEDIYEE